MAKRKRKKKKSSAFKILNFAYQTSMVAKVVGICIDYDQKKWSENKNAISRPNRAIWMKQY